jgi:hypothetical protein
VLAVSTQDSQLSPTCQHLSNCKLLPFVQHTSAAFESSRLPVALNMLCVCLLPGDCTHAALYAQCGGASAVPAGVTGGDAAWAGTCCPSGSGCSRVNEYYWQCLPGAADAPAAPQQSQPEPAAAPEAAPEAAPPAAVAVPAATPAITPAAPAASNR